MGKRIISIRYCLFFLLLCKQIISASGKILFIETHLKVKCSFRLATPSSALGNLCVPKAQYNRPSKLFEVYDKARSIKEKAGQPGLLGSTHRICPCPGFQAWALLPVVYFT